MDEPLLLGVDIGTQTSKGVLATADGAMVASAEVTHDVERPRPGHVEQDAESVWWPDFVELTRLLITDAEIDPHRVAGLATSGIGPCLLAADADGRPLRKAILYGVDTRATKQIAELETRFGPEEVRRRGRAPLTSQAVGPKLLWLRQEEPETYDRMAKLLMASSFLVHRLTGQYVLDHHSASGVNPFYDAATRDWHRPWADEVLGPLELPRLLWATDVAGEVTAWAAEETGLLAGTPVTAGTVDAAAEALSVGVRLPGDLMLMYGTTMFLIQVVEDLPAEGPFWGTSYVLPGSSSLAAGMTTSGALTAWFRSLLGRDAPSYAVLVEEAARVPAGSGGLVVLPYFAGERTPLHDPDARGVVAGLTLDHGRGHLYRALLESTAYGVRHNLEAMRDAGAAPQRLVAVGGGTKGDLWPQIVSDVTGQAQDLPRQTIGAALGDAFLAGVATGLVDPDREWNPIVGRCELREEHRAVYDRLYAVYQRLHAASVDEQHVLARIAAEEASAP